MFALSIEFVPMALIDTEVALDRLMQLGDYAFNASYGDDMRLLHPAPLSANDIRAGCVRSAMMARQAISTLVWMPIPSGADPRRDPHSLASCHI